MPLHGPLLATEILNPVHGDSYIADESNTPATKTN